MQWGSECYWVCCIDYDKIRTFSLVNLEIEKVTTRGHQNVSLNWVALDPFKSDKKKTESEIKGLILNRLDKYEMAIQFSFQ